MLFSMMIALALASFVVEMMFAAKIVWWRQNAYRLKWLNMVISLLLSWILGLMFGAAGLIVMGAAMISTAMSIPGYAFLHWNYDSSQATKHGGNMLIHVRNKWIQAFKDLAKVIYAIIRIITFPIWFTRWVFNKISKRNY
jgi:hypothetical protein